MNANHRHPLLISAICGAFALLLGACRDPKITTYNAPKDAQPAALPSGHPDISAMPAMSGAAAPSDASDMGAASASGMAVGSDALTWTAPADWKPKAPGPMRKGSYDVPGETAADADLSIFSFPGDTGGLLGNINRWRGQIGLEPLAESDLAANITRVAAGENSPQITVVDFASKDASTRMLAAILPGKGETYFFKLTGPASTVAAQKNAFLAMLQTVKIQQ